MNAINAADSLVFTNLSWAFRDNMPALEVLFRKYGDNTAFLSGVDSQVADLRDHGCRGLDSRADRIPTSDPGDCLREFASFRSEILFGVHFAKHGWRVKFLHESPYNTTPDLLCETSHDRFLVEVTRLTEDSVLETVLGFLRLLFRVMPNLHVIINVDFKEELALPEVEKEGRYRQNRLVLRSLGEFMGMLPRSKPLMAPRVIETEGIVFSIEPNELGKGYPGIFNSGVIKVPTEKLQKRISCDLVIKAKKQPSFEKELTSLKYVLAYDSEEPLVDKMDIEELLFGSRITRHIGISGGSAILEREWKEITESPEKWIPDWKRIAFAAGCGWENLLKDQHLIPGGHTCLLSPGLFLNCSAMTNVTAVIVRHPSGILEGYPNPFCRPEINLRGVIPDYLKKAEI